MADEDLFAAAEAKARQKQAAEKGRNAEWYKGPQAAMSSFLSTMTGGGADYVDMLVRRQRGENVDVDQTRAKMQELHEDRPGWATGGRVGGTVAQYLPAGRALKAAGWAGAAAPGVMAGIKSGLAQGGIVGSFNELMRQLDRAGSTKRAEEQFNPLSSAGRVGLEAGFGGAGGALGGTIAGMTAPGVIATAAPKPLSPAAIAAATDAARAGEAAGLTGAGRMGAHEAARAAAARNPALGPELEEAATGLGGILSQAGRKVVPTGITPRRDGGGSGTRRRTFPTVAAGRSAQSCGSSSSYRPADWPNPNTGGRSSRTCCARHDCCAARFGRSRSRSGAGNRHECQGCRRGASDADCRGAGTYGRARNRSCITQSLARRARATQPQVHHRSRRWRSRCRIGADRRFTRPWRGLQAAGAGAGLDIIEQSGDVGSRGIRRGREGRHKVRLRRRPVNRSSTKRSRRYSGLWVADRVANGWAQSGPVCQRLLQAGIVD